MRASALVWGGRVVEATRAEKREVDKPVRGLEEGRRYSWVEDHLARLDGKEVRGEYYAWLMSGDGP